MCRCSALMTEITGCCHDSPSKVMLPQAIHNDPSQKMSGTVLDITQPFSQGYSRMVLQLFDAPDAIQSIGNRGVTTVPPQALAMMNSPLIRRLAEQLADRVLAKNETDPQEIVRETFWTTLSRPPQQLEAEQMSAFIKEQASRYGNEESGMVTAVADYCQLMLCLNEFVYVD